MTVARDGAESSTIGLHEVELSAPPWELGACGGCAEIRVLVRLYGAPLGWVRIERPGDRVGEGALVHAITTQLRREVARAALQKSWDADTSPETPQPAVSVVVCTRDRTTSLERCLQSLLALDHPAFEVVVVDNAPSSPESASLVERLRTTSARAHTLLRYVREDRPGLDWARNRGADAARHEILAYTDDDVRVDRGWLRAIGRAFRDEAVMLVTGLVIPAELETMAQRLFEDAYGGMGKGVQPLLFRGAAMSPALRLSAHHVGVGANLALRRAWLARLGGFDTALDVGTPSHGAGDLDIIHRTLAAGGTARYEPTAIVHHYHRRELPALRRQLRDNGRAFGVYLLTRWHRHERPRSAVLRYAAGVWLWWMLGRIPRRLGGSERLPLSLQLEEWVGALQAPWAWRATYAHDRRVRQATNGPAPSNG